MVKSQNIEWSNHKINYGADFERSPPSFLIRTATLYRLLYLFSYPLPFSYVILPRFSAVCSFPNTFLSSPSPPFESLLSSGLSSHVSFLFLSLNLMSPLHLSSPRCSVSASNFLASFCLEYLCVCFLEQVFEKRSSICMIISSDTFSSLVFKC